MNKRVPAAVACVLVDPSMTAVPVRMMNPKGESVTVYAGITVYSYMREGGATHVCGGCCK